MNQYKFLIHPVSPFCNFSDFAKFLFIRREILTGQNSSKP